MKRWAPYQLFFPLGVAASLVAILIWILQPLGLFSAPAMVIHSRLITGGFLWSFITGFLMTAVPRMTGTKSAQPFEVSVALLLVLWMAFEAFQFPSLWFYGVHAGLIVWLAAFALRRLVVAQKAVPVFFSHVGLGLLSALAGCYYMLQANSYMGLHLYQVGALLLLVLGIGTRFFSFLSGLPSSFEGRGKTPHLIFHAHGVLVLILLFLAGQGHPLSYLALGFLSLSYLFFIWKIQRPSSRPSPMKWAVRLVALSIPITFFLCYLQPAKFVTWLHILFIGTFALITYCVASRVTLAHGSYSTDLELNSKPLWAMLVLITFSLMARLGYGVTPGELKPHLLHLAVGLWALAVVVWGLSFVVKIFVPGPQSKPSC